MYTHLRHDASGRCLEAKARRAQWSAKALPQQEGQELTDRWTQVESSFQAL